MYQYKFFSIFRRYVMILVRQGKHVFLIKFMFITLLVLGKKPSKWLGWFQRNVPQLASGHRIYIPYLTVFYPKPLLENSFKMARLILIKLSTTSKWALKFCINNIYYFNFNFGLKNSEFCPIVHLKVKYIPITQKTKVFEIRWAPLHEDF